MLLRDRNHPSIVIWGIGNEIPELEVDQRRALAKQLVDHVRLPRQHASTHAGVSRHNHQSNCGSSVLSARHHWLQLQHPAHLQTGPRAVAVAHNADHGILALEGFSAMADFARQLVCSRRSHVDRDGLLWASPGIGAWQYGTPQQAKMAEGMAGMMAGTAMVDQLFTGMANGKDVMGEMAKSNSDPNAKAMMELFFHPYPWHAAACGDIDLTGFRKPQSYYRDIIWNGGDRVYATVRLPEPEGKKIIAIMWANYPTLSYWNWPGQEGKELEVEVYSGAEKVQLFLNDKLIGEKPTGREQEFKAVFPVPYAPGTLKAVGLRGDRVVAENVLTTRGTSSQAAPDSRSNSAAGGWRGPFVRDR